VKPCCSRRAKRASTADIPDDFDHEQATVFSRALCDPWNPRYLIQDAFV